MDKSTANAIEAEAAWSRKPYQLSLPQVWQEIQREAREQLVSWQHCIQYYGVLQGGCHGYGCAR